MTQTDIGLINVSILNSYIIIQNNMHQRAFQDFCLRLFPWVFKIVSKWVAMTYHQTSHRYGKLHIYRILRVKNLRINNNTFTFKRHHATFHNDDLSAGKSLLLISKSEMVSLVTYLKIHIRTWKKSSVLVCEKPLPTIWIQKRHENILNESPSNNISITKYLNEVFWKVIKNPQ